MSSRCLFISISLSASSDGLTTADTPRYRPATADSSATSQRQLTVYNTEPDKFRHCFVFLFAFLTVQNIFNGQFSSVPPQLAQLRRLECPRPPQLLLWVCFSDVSFDKSRSPNLLEGDGPRVDPLLCLST